MKTTRPCTLHARSPRKALFLSLLFPAALFAADGPKEVPLWPAGAPGSEGKTAKEIIETGAGAYRRAR